MVKANVGGIDKKARMIFGVILLVWPFLAGGVSAAGTVGIISMIAGAVFLVTGLINFCPIWAVIGVNTNK